MIRALCAATIEGARRFGYVRAELVEKFRAADPKPPSSAVPLAVTQTPKTATAET